MDETRTRRRWMSRPRSLRAGFLVSVLVHAGIVILFVTVWNLLPFPPIRPIRVFALPNAPTRSQVGAIRDGRIVPDPTPSPAVLDSAGLLR